MMVMMMLYEDNDGFDCCLHLLVITVRMTELRGMFSRTFAE